MDQIVEFVDERQKGWCVHCGGSLAGTEANRDHVPSRGLLHPPYPENLPVVPICVACNSGFSQDEEYLIAFLGAVLAGSTDPDRQQNPSAARVLRRSPKLRARIDRSRSDYPTHGGGTRIVWKPDSDRIERVVVKNARGHAFFEIGEPMLNQPSYARAVPLESLGAAQRTGFKNLDLGEFWPEVGSRMMTRVLTGQDMIDGWIIVQDGVYRYAVAQTGGILVRSVLFEYLATEVCWEG